MQTKDSIIDKFDLMGFRSEKERIIFEHRLDFDYTCKQISEQPICASNT